MHSRCYERREHTHVYDGVHRLYPVTHIDTFTAGCNSIARVVLRYTTRYLLTLTPLIFHWDFRMLIVCLLEIQPHYFITIAAAPMQ